MNQDVYLGKKAMIEGQIFTIIACHDKSGLAQYCLLMNDSGEEFEAYIKPDMLMNERV